MDFRQRDEQETGDPWAGALREPPAPSPVAHDVAPEAQHGGHGHAEPAALGDVFGHLADHGPERHPERPHGMAHEDVMVKAAMAKKAPTVTSSTEVSEQVSDGPYGWTAAYTVQSLSDGSMRVLIKVKVEKDADVTSKQAKKVKTQTQAAFRKFWDRKFQLTGADQKSHPLDVQLQWVDSGQHLTVALHSGEGRDDLSNWYVDSNSNDRAHELGHQLGMKDEYVDATVPNRATATSPGVHTDHSIMGQYYTEGIGKAHVHQRHGNVLAGMISRATGQNYAASRIPRHKKKPKDEHPK